MKRLLTLWLLAALPLTGQEKGTITGRLSDSETGEPLPGVNVMVKGTYYGAASDGDGFYRITNVSAGSYDMEVSMIGYKVILRTGVKVNAGQTTTVDFQLEQTVLALGEEVVVVGKKPLFDVDETASITKLSSDDLEDMIVHSVEDILAEQVGVTKVNNEIHIRGGRVDESLYIIDGLSIKDPLSGYSGNLFVNAESIEDLEIITGGYDAEYGQAMSGIINIRLKEGRDKFEGSIKYLSDHWGAATGAFEHFNSDRFEVNLGGPSPLLELMAPRLGVDLPGKFSFFANAYGKITDSQLPSAKRLYPHRNWIPPSGLSTQKANNLLGRLAPRENNDWHALYKLSWQPDDMKKLSASYDISLNINQGFFMPRAFSTTYFPYAYSQMLDNYNTITRESRLAKINWTHTLSPRSFYELTIGQFLTLEHSAVQDLHWTDYRERLDIEPVNYIIRDRNGNVRITYGDEFYDTGFSPEWYDLSSNNTRLDLDWTYQTLSQHKIKSGLELTSTEIQVVDIDEPWTGTTGFGINYDAYRARTLFGAFYVQDRIVFEGMTANLGLRYDYWFPGKYVEDAIANPDAVTITDEARERFIDETFEFMGYRGKARLSPRVGISHPVTDNDVLYFYYGHFSQLPTFQYVYAKLNTTAPSTYQVFGNPNLSPKTTVQYEIGLKHRFSEDQVLEMKAYWKDMFDYETSQSITPSNPKYAHLQFLMYLNADYARARGIEIILKSRLLTNWYADVNFNYSIATGKSSNPNDNLLVQSGQLREKPLDEVFLRWDKPLQTFANISYDHPSGWGMSWRFEFESGQRYTRSIPGTREYPDGLIELEDVTYFIGTVEDDKPYFYLAKNPVSNVDLKLYKKMSVGGVNLRWIAEVENLLDQRIPRRINPFTGRGYNPGVIIPYSMIEVPNPNFDPSRFRTPRTAIIGFQVMF
ncbi:MAG: TonB-dependent receptor [Arenicellales bacterium]|jgi:outer membrane receptor for Fe3+-dicitrate|nr:TonB-dependent receptor [Arenicellales bacterium]